MGVRASVEAAEYSHNKLLRAELADTSACEKREVCSGGFVENKDVDMTCDRCGRECQEDELVRYSLMTLCHECDRETKKDINPQDA